MCGSPDPPIVIDGVGRESNSLGREAEREHEVT